MRPHRACHTANLDFFFSKKIVLRPREPPLSFTDIHDGDRDADAAPCSLHREHDTLADADLFPDTREIRQGAYFHPVRTGSKVADPAGRSVNAL
jgi:hypothetical protein